jgi:hypothetical protein
MSGMRITLQRLGTPTEGTGVEGAAATGEVVAWRDGDPAPVDPAVGTSDDSGAPQPPRDSSAGLAPAPDHPRVSSRGAGPDTVRLVVIVPFREDGSGRESQLRALLARLNAMFLPGECLVVVAEQSDDGRKFNRGQLLNAAFAHVRETHGSDTLDAHTTLYCFHDCDMLPDKSLAPHYLRGPPVTTRAAGTSPADEKILSENADASALVVRGFVRVLCADGGRYDADACFGGVTIYDQEGFEATNGYQNGFWGWGGEDNAQFLRCARAGLALERVRGCPFHDLEGVETVTEKLARLDAAQARCASKEKKRLLRENARGWENDGLTSVAYDATSCATVADVATNDSNDSDEPSLRLSRFAFRLRAAIKDEVVCFECGERKGPAGFASNQHKRAMFYAARDSKNRSLPFEKNEKTGTENDGSTPSNENENANVPERQTRESFWRERNAVARLCHWDERGIEANVSRKASPCEGARSSRVRSDGGEIKPSQDEKLVEKKKDVKFVARCLACVAKDPEVSAYRRRAERNDADASRTTCVRCGVRFEKRNKLFEHLKASPCGVQDGEVIEGHVSTRG